MIRKKLLRLFLAEPGEKIRLKDYPTGWDQIEGLEPLGKEVVRERAAEVLERNRRELAEMQGRLYADNRYSLLIIFQAMDAAGKDGTIKHVMSGVNPQGCQVFSFKHPSAEELDHTFLWRYMKCLPERGRIGIFNRSHYEDVLVVKVHPELLEAQRLPVAKFGKRFWEARYEDINAFERHLARNGTVILKFFLHLSKEEQKKRFLERLTRPEKHWKFSASDLAERRHWDDYMKAYERAIRATSTAWAPWYIVPADHKWATRAIVADIIVSSLKRLDLRYPEPDPEQLAALEAARRELENES
ncbi:hypothetical protein MIN45_P0940 [Methylomarinovum tepidoasis]|uniref:Polyphosphate kinase-2-related domain-containing protein n=1 Tax=Methylomarinovum tepidoasis TaxID=2840183 RepID=A0AAU9C9L6_9GAMM|nr:polyphosphate kinase 2 family protein [Methylomarinovum sp. IN45]BCX88571.1 hypothetical protein MIN45_P0940 [Methylomarinovum sp. IN45]